MKTRIEFDLRSDLLGDADEDPSRMFYYMDWADDTNVEVVNVIDGREALALKVRIVEDEATQILRDALRL